jgi:alkylation response protein AidB-like acyl-CoA dehydrogenase
VSHAEQKLASAEELEEFRAAVRAWLSTNLPREWGETNSTADQSQLIERRRLWDRVVWEGGYAGITWPTIYGGRELGLAQEFVFHEEAAVAHAPEPLNIIGLHLAGPAILDAGSEDQKRRFLPRILSAEDLWCEGFSEPGAGSDLAAVTTTATPVEGGYRVTGQKTWTSFADLASRCYLLARTDARAARHHNVSVLLIDMHQPGIVVTPIREITGARHFTDVFFDDVFVSEDDRLGPENGGWELVTLGGLRRQMTGLLDSFRRYVAMKTVLDQLRQCVNECSRHGLIAEVEVLEQDMGLLQWHIRRTLGSMATANGWQKSSSILRIWWSELWQRMAETGLSVHCPAHQDYWRLQYLQTMAWTIAGASAQLQRNVIAERVLGLPR